MFIRHAHARIMINGRPGAVVPHGTSIALVGGARFEVVWPLWRRVLFVLGIAWAALCVDDRGRLAVTVREVWL